MESARVWYGFDNEHEKRKGAWINLTDLELLSLIWTNRYLTNKQLTKYGNQLFGYKGDSIQKKLKRWSNYAIVKIEYQSVLNKPPISCYYLGKNGINILKQEGIIKEEEKAININNYIRNSSHYLGIQDVVIDTLIALKTNRKNIISIHPNKDTYKNEVGEPFIVPDWVFRKGSRTLNIEYDTGLQTMTKIKEKIRNYIKLSKHKPEEEHYVLISVADNSNIYTVKYYDDRRTRVLNIKDTIIHKGADKISNLHFYVTTASRSPIIANNILKGIYPFDKSTFKSEQELFELSMEISNSNYQLVPLPKKEIFHNDSYNIGEIAQYELIHKERTNSKQVLVLNIVEEASVAALNKINFLEEENKNNKFKQEVSHLLIVYQSRSELENDIVMKNYETLKFTDTKNWPLLLQGEKQLTLEKKKGGRVLERTKGSS